MQQTFKVFVGYKIKPNKRKLLRRVKDKVNPFDRLDEVVISDEALDAFIKESVEEVKVPDHSQLSDQI